MRILNKIIFFCYVSMCINACAQTTFFNGLVNGSWKTHRIPISGSNLTIENHIIRAFNAAEWGRGDAENKIFPGVDSLDAIINYYATLENRYRNRAASLFNDDSPRRFMFKLHLHEIHKLKNLINNHDQILIDNNNYDTDDLVKARSLCGTFWIVSRIRNPTKSFSGILIPGQQYNQAGYQVYTCMHGFTSGNNWASVCKKLGKCLRLVPDDGIEYYFVPYGVNVVTNDRNDREYITRVGFKVTHVRHFRDQENGANLNINDRSFATDSLFMQNRMLYSNNDFAVATIEARTANRRLLKDILTDTELGIVQEADNNLPNINVNDDYLQNIDTQTAYNPNEERLFAIGFASIPDLALAENMIISTNITNEVLSTDFLRSFRDDENVKRPPDTRPLQFETAASFPAYFGMSGGPVLRCRLDPANNAIKKCTIIGTTWGAERIFNEEMNLVGFKSFINILPNATT